MAIGSIGPDKSLTAYEYEKAIKNAQEAKMDGGYWAIVKKEDEKDAINQRGAAYDPSANAPVNLSENRMGVQVYRDANGRVYEVLDDPDSRREKESITAGGSTLKADEVDLSDYSTRELSDLLKSGRITQYAYELEMKKRGMEDTDETTSASTQISGTAKENFASVKDQGINKEPRANSVTDKEDTQTKGVSPMDDAAKRRETSDQIKKNQENIEGMFKSVQTPPKPLDTVMPEFALPETSGNMGGKVTIS